MLFKKSDKPGRNSALEILRIIAMLMIFFHHAVIHGGTSFGTPIDFQDFMKELMYHAGKLGVLLYVLISGYYLSVSKFTIRKVAKLVIEVYLFSTMGLIINLVNNHPAIDANFVFTYSFPFSGSQYWFVSSYLVLLLASPLLKIVLDHINKRIHIAIIIIMVVMCSIMSCIFNLNTYATSYLSFIMLYFIGAFLRKYPLPDLKGWKWLVLGVSIAIYFGMTALLVSFNNDSYSRDIVHKLYYTYNSPICMIIGVGIMIFFIQLKPFTSKIINVLGLATFEVYLFHDNNQIRPHIFHIGIDSATIPHSNIWWLEFVGVTLLRFVVVLAICVVIKLIYNYTIAKLVDITSDKINNAIANRKNKKEQDYDGSQSNQID